MPTDRRGRTRATPFIHLKPRLGALRGALLDASRLAARELPHGKGHASAPAACNAGRTVRLPLPPRTRTRAGARLLPRFRAAWLRSATPAPPGEHARPSVGEADRRGRGAA